ncbi:MAG: hypothetical protein PHU04_02110 [Candidatus Peribacteraceae bacterium]|nr:hypothetical protein [Candidatus Peribacteraceae bacterium]
MRTPDENDYAETSAPEHYDDIPHRPSNDPAFTLVPGELQDLHHKKLYALLGRGLDPVDASKDPADLDMLASQTIADQLERD